MKYLLLKNNLSNFSEFPMLDLTHETKMNICRRTFDVCFLIDKYCEMWTIIRLQWYNYLKVFENYRKDEQFHETTDDFRSISKAGVHL